jgi:hypothetical protein
MADLPDRGVKESSAVGGCFLNVLLWGFFLVFGIIIGSLVVKFLPYFLFAFIPPLRDRLLLNDADSSMLIREIIGGTLGGIIALRYLLMARKEARRHK